MSIVDTLVSSESIMVHVVAELFKIVSEIDSEKGKAAEAVVNPAIEKLNMMAMEKEKEATEARNEASKLAIKVSSLEDEVASLKRCALSSQVELIKGNVMVRSSKTQNDVSDYICKTIAKSGASKPPSTSFFIQQIGSDTSKKDKSPKKVANKVVPPTYLYKVHLGGKLKNDLFKGLSVASTTRSSTSQDFQVSHDVPKFLYKQRDALEKAAFSLRREHKDKEVRTKVVLKGFNLVLFLKSKEITDWVNIENDKAALFRSTKLEMKEGDSTPQGDVDSLIKSLARF